MRGMSTSSSPAGRRAFLKAAVATGAAAFLSLNVPAVPSAGGKMLMKKLNNGMSLPMVGLGTYSLKGETCVRSVYEAIRQGYRLIDTAHMYGNEKEVGIAVRRAVSDGLVAREDVFVITKLYPNQFSQARSATDEALGKLDLGFLDMMLLHHPGPKDAEAYGILEGYVTAGRIRARGLSNYYIRELDDFVGKVHLPPALVQNEIHPYYQDSEVTKHILSKGIAVQAWYPLGGRGHQKELLNDPVLLRFARAHGKSVAQIMLRWNVQNGVIVIPGSSNPAHIEENISIFDFELSGEDMRAIAALNRNEKHDWY